MSYGVDAYKVIAVSGPMAAGKNYICSQLESEGWHSIDADKVVHAAIENQSEKILTVFSEKAGEKGLKLKNEDGSVNRRALGALLFSDKKLLSMQEDIVYPEVTRIINSYIDEHPEQKVAINATVLYKTPILLARCQMLLYVRAGVLKRYKRVRSRDALPARQILRRFWFQRSLLHSYKSSGIQIRIIDN